MDRIVEPIPPAETLDLRQRILRPHQPRQECVYPLDDHPQTLHLGCRVGGRLVAVGTVLPEDRDGGLLTGEWRIRGMAVDGIHQGQGLGRRILQGLIAHGVATRGRAIWCNGRTGVEGFYKGEGFERVGDEFQLPGIGPHVLLVRGPKQDSDSETAQ